jgi:tetratricopeptide (TPR) repeat protein
LTAYPEADVITVMDPLAPPDTHHLTAAQGWIELGNYVEADAELDKIAQEFRAHPDVLGVRWCICAKAGKWETCVDLAAAVVAADPKRPSGWIQRSFALHELKRTQEALDLLEPAANLFLDEWNIRYNLACYACQLGKHDEALEWLKDALDLAEDKKAVKTMAMDDKDLEPLWVKIGDL